MLVAGTFVNKLGSFIMPFLTLVLKRELHLGPEVGSCSRPRAPARWPRSLPAGLLTDRLGRRE